MSLVDSPRPSRSPPALPRPTRDLEQTFEDLDRFGYAILEGALSRERVAALRARVVEQARGEDAQGIGFHDGKANQRIWMLPNKGRIFRDLMLDPLVDIYMGRLLGKDFLLSSLTANIARPGGVPMYLHTDQGYVDFWTPKPLVANILWMLDDFTEANGGTRLVPGSHLDPHRTEYALSDTIAAEGPAGAALVFDGRMVHGTGSNTTQDEERHGVLTYFCRPFIRQQENYLLGFDPAPSGGPNAALSFAGSAFGSGRGLDAPTIPVSAAPWRPFPRRSAPWIPKDNLSTSDLTLAGDLPCRFPRTSPPSTRTSTTRSMRPARWTGSRPRPARPG